jgi:hypothetical protein
MLAINHNQLSLYHLLTILTLLGIITIPKTLPIIQSITTHQLTKHPYPSLPKNQVPTTIVMSDDSSKLAYLHPWQSTQHSIPKS